MASTTLIRDPVKKGSFGNKLDIMSKEDIEKTEEQPEEPNVSEEIIEENAELKQAVANLTSEIKELREKKNAEIEELRQVQVEPVDESDPDDVQAIASKAVESFLNKRAEQDAEDARKSAEDSFKQANKEFHPDNDPGGIKYKAFQKTLNKFSLEGLKTREDFESRFNEAYEFMRRKDPQAEDEVINPYAETPKNPSATPKVDDGAKLDKREEALLKQKGWDKERYLKVKAKRPEYVRTLLQYVQ